MNDGPLTNLEIEFLEAYFDSKADLLGTPTFEEVDGLFTAAHCGPDPVTFEDAVLCVDRGQMKLDRVAEGPLLMRLLLRHWISTQNDLIARRWSPTFGRTDDPQIRGKAWATGFVKWAGAHTESWDRLLRQDVRILLVPIFTLRDFETWAETLREHGHHVDREKLILGLPATVLAITSFWKSERMRNLGKNLERAGRNDPCPCGSGRKFKRCCG